MGQITTLTKLKKILQPYSATLVGGVFDLFHVGHLRYLKRCSEVGRPLVVIVQTDKTARIRKGFKRPIINQKQRAEIVAALGFVDFVLILERAEYYEKYLEIIKPKYFVFFKGIMKYKKYRTKLINEKFPKIKTVFFNKIIVKQLSTSSIIWKILTKTQRDYSKIRNLIIRRLCFVADYSKASISKISALLTFRGRIVAESDNSENCNVHPEYIVIKKAKQNGIPLNKSKLYTLIQPCILCAQEILRNRIREVYYLHPYGNDDGIKLLCQNGVKVRKLK